MSGAIQTAEDQAHLLRMMRCQMPSTVHCRECAAVAERLAAERMAGVLFIDAKTSGLCRRLY
jgi:hypothetical protein